MASNSNLGIGPDSDEEDRVDDPVPMEQDGGNLQPHHCDIAPYLENSRIDSQCSGNHKLLSSESNEAVILKRCGIVNEVIDMMICDNHHDLLGKRFTSKYTSKKYCFWKEHPDRDRWPKPNDAISVANRPRKKRRLTSTSAYYTFNESKSKLLL